MTNTDAALSQNQFDVSQAEAEHMVQPHGMANDLGREPMTVVGVGAGVSDFSPGDDVFGRGSGTYAEYAVADSRFCFPIDRSFSDVEAAPLLCAGLIGYRALTMAGDAVRLTMTESHDRPLSDDILSGGRQGWPAILSSLKSLLETGEALVVKMQPPQRMLAALQKIGIKTP